MYSAEDFFVRKCNEINGLGGALGRNTLDLWGRNSREIGAEEDSARHEGEIWGSWFDNENTSPDFFNEREQPDDQER
ncbi:hypothetical protein [Pseudomonas sp. R5(2019)]|uniref:hypothetical protein n=1 Tax=Pseudomonas sp. R5(2019) TaxID=2697566 RepID=UPI0014129B79|nr:hypothetical protein [Pseudomonas sp. R5(2019)]NBA94048.1 hypothetical protein [Pseudomonas sp. R5(2019)]